jgi:hypothetical protein
MRATLAAVGTVATLLTTVLAAAPLSPAGAQSVDPRAVPGVWKPVFDLTNSPNLAPDRPASAAQVRAMKQELLAIVDILHAMPVFARPVGMIAQPLVGVGEGGTWPGSRRWPLAGRAGVKILEHWVDGGKLRADGSGAEFGFGVQVNSLECVFERAPAFQDAIGPIFDRPPEVATVDGRLHAGGCTLLTRSAEPPFVPVTRARMLALFVAQIDSGLKELEPMLPHLSGEGRANVQATVTAQRARQQRYRQWLATWSTEERNAQAVLGPPTGESPFAAHSDAGIGLVEPNPRLLDPSRPTDVQLITVRDFKVPAWQQVEAQIDWGALRARLK